MTATARTRSLDALWDLREVLKSDGPGLGLPLALLDGIRTMIGTDTVAFNYMDSRQKRHLFWQTADSDDVGEGLFNPDDEDHAFWEHYWDSPCSWPDRTADITAAMRVSDLVGGLEWRGSPVFVDCPSASDHEIMVAWHGAEPGQTLRLICFRNGCDFSEEDKFILELLRPHLGNAYAHAKAERDKASRRGPASLTERQRDVLKLAGQGSTNYAIGRRLGISEGTVRTHLQHVYAALGVSSRTAAAMALAEVEIR